jgi:hypothetical protein
MRREQWRWIWGLWLLVIIALTAGSFGLLEYLAWQEGGTLSWTAAMLPPYAVFVIGWMVGGLTCALTVHFWWHWVPK